MPLFPSRKPKADPRTHRLTAPNLALLYQRAAQTYETLPAFATRIRPGEWRPTSFRDLYTQGQAVATALIELGVGYQDHIGLLSDNRFEWILADYATQLCAAANVPRGSDVTDDEITTIFRHAGVRIAFVETTALQERILALRNALPELEQLILLDPDGAPRAGTLRIQELAARGEALRAAGDRQVEARIAQIRPDDLFTLIYTSGTTGEPKGVMLTHANMISQVENIPVDIGCTDRVVSILPIWHIFERVFEMFSISNGCCTYYTSVRTLQDDLREVEPTFMGSAPRLWESLHQRILKTVRQRHPMRRALFRIAYFLSVHYQESLFFLTRRRGEIDRLTTPTYALLAAGHALRWLLLLPWYGFFNAAVLEQVRLAVGGALRASVSGGGALPDEIDRFFNYLGIPVLEGYGLTESSPVIAVRTYDKLLIDTVGPVMPQTELRIVCLDSGRTLYPDPTDAHGGRGRKGEIVVRGPQVMKGYYRNPEATAETLRDGWLYTGDLGVVTYRDCLQVVGRRKETIVLANGENVQPAPIELELLQSPLIEQCVVVGQDRRYAAALIVPSIGGFREAGWAVNSVAELADEQSAKRAIEAEVKQRISTANGFRPHERIQRLRLLGCHFASGHELTTLLKVKRHVIAEKYRDEIEALYP